MTCPKSGNYSVKDKKHFSCLLNLLLVFSPIVFILLYNSAKAEDITITTYYPSPNGSYDALIAKRFSVGDVNADGSINASDISASSGYLLVADRLGIRTTTPQTQLQINAADEDYAFPNPGSTARGALFIRSTTSDKETGITFSSANSNNAQAGIYVHQDSAAGTHMYLATTDVYATGPQVRMTILNSGNIGIGTTTPTSKFHIYDTTNMPAVPDVNSQAPFKVSDGTIGILMDANQIESVGGDLYFNHRATGGTGKNVILACGGGNVGIGTSTPGGKLEVYYPLNTSGLYLTSPGYDTDSLNAGLRFHSTSDSGYQGDVVLYHRGSGDPGLDIWGYPYNSTPSCCMLIAHFSNNGNVGIGTSAPTSNLHVYDNSTGSYTDNALKVATGYGYATFGSLNASWFHISTDRPAFYFNNPCQANGGFSTYSSRERKKDIQHLSEPEEDKILESLTKMQMARFRYKDERFNKKVHLGIIAEESPDQLLTEDKNAIELVDYISYAVTAIKAQQREIKAQQSEIEELKKEIRRLKNTRG